MSTIIDKNVEGRQAMNLLEIGSRVRERREALGLTQERLAKLAGLSRATINQLETGALKDLGVTKLAVLIELVGLRLEAHAVPRARHGLVMASRTASVSYRSPIEAGQLAQALATGHIPSAVTPHVATLIDEAPLPIIVAAVEEAAQCAHVPPRRIWRNVARWARDMRSPRSAWA